ncbi:MAG TPA: CBS domain-containing protein, partial [Anaeromyxobacteraceae bacterium]|nr:CBS domain-containing protein [Anaeromyxobacteraceae bacterium]
MKADTQTPLSHILAGKSRGTATLTVPPEVTVAAAAEVLIRNQVGSVVVLDGGRLVGIFTERDILRRVVGERRDPT